MWVLALIRGEAPPGCTAGSRGSCATTPTSARTGSWSRTRSRRFRGWFGTYPVDVDIAPPVRQTRWSVALRPVLALPALVFLFVLLVVLDAVVGCVGWFAALATGRMPRGMRDLMAYCLRYQAQTYAYLALLTGRYPSLAGSGYRRTADEPSGVRPPRKFRGALVAAYDPPVPRVVLIVNPFASGVTRERLDAVEAALRASAEVVTRQTEARGHAQALAEEAAGDRPTRWWSSPATAPTTRRSTAPPDGCRSASCRAAGRASSRARSACRASRSRLPRRSRPRSRTAARRRSASVASTDGASASRPGSGSTPRSCAAWTRAGARPTAAGPGDVVFATTAVGALARRRLHLEPQLEIAGHGRAAFVLAGCGRPYTYAGPVPLRLSDGGAGLDFVAPVRVTPATLPQLGFRLLRGTLARDGRVLAGSGLDSFDVRCDLPLPLQLDGEDIGDVTEARFEAEPDALDGSRLGLRPYTGRDGRLVHDRRRGRPRGRDRHPRRGLHPQPLGGHRAGGARRPRPRAAGGELAGGGRGLRRRLPRRARRGARRRGCAAARRHARRPRRASRRSGP